MKKFSTKSNSLKYLFLILIIISVFVLFFGWIYYENERENLISERSKDIQSIGSIKHNQISQWFNERLADARFIFESNSVQKNIYNFMHYSANKDSIDLIKTIQPIYKNHDYHSLYILDINKKVRLNLNPSYLPDSKELYFSDSAFSYKNIVNSDLQINSTNNEVYIGIYIPVFFQNKPIAVVVLNVDPDILLFPIAKTWQVRSETGESFLVRKDEDSISFLNETRFRNYLPLSLKLSIKDNKDLTAAMAVEGFEGTIVGKDYRNEEVLADVKKVFGTNWFLITKQDLSEILQPLKYNVITACIIIFLFTGLGSLIILYLHNRQNLLNLVKYQQSEKRYKDLFQQASDCIFILNDSLQIIDYNKATLDLLKFSDNELKGLNIDDILIEEKEGSKLKNLLSLKIQSVFLDKIHFKTKNNSIVTLEISAKLLPQGDIQCIARNITEREKYVLALKESEYLYRTLVENANSVIIFLSPEFKVLDWNQEAEKFYGITKDEILNKNYLDLFIHPHEKEEIITYLNSVLNGHPVKNYERNILTKKGLRTILFNVSNVENKGLIAIGQDISERKNIDKQIKASETKFRTLFEKSNDAIFLMDNFTFIDCNPRAEKLYLSSKEEILGKTPLYFSPELQPDGLSSKEKALDYIDKAYKGIPSLFEWLHNNREKEFYTEVNLSTVIIDQKTLLVAIVRDISERKKFEKEIIEAKNKAEESNKLKTNFLANMSHELRTPMVGILGFADILNEELKDNNLKGMVGSIMTSGKRLMDTLNLILDLSRIEANKYNLYLKYTDISKVVREEVLLFEGAARKKNLKLELKLKENLFLKSDSKVLHNIISNLLNNAIKFTNEGSITVHLDNDSDSIVLAVEDTGIGITGESQKYIFEEFRQVSEGLSRTFEGTGLGLTLTRKFVGLLGGTITVESRVNHGSKFIVKFPILNGADKNFNKEIIVGNLTGNSIHIPNNSVPKILLVENDFTAVQVMKIYLKNHSKLDVASNGNEAIKMANENNYSLIFMDINLGEGINGLEVTKHLRKQEKYKSIPIVALTAYAMPNEREEFLSAGCSHYVSKPFNKTTILNLLTDIMQEK